MVIGGPKTYAKAAAMSHSKVSMLRQKDSLNPGATVILKALTRSVSGVIGQPITVMDQ